jgi:hypothetical protein
VQYSKYRSHSRAIWKKLVEISEEGVPGYVLVKATPASTAPRAMASLPSNSIFSPGLSVSNLCMVSSFVGALWRRVEKSGVDIDEIVFYGIILL